MIAAVGSQTADIEPGRPWENGECGRLNAKLRDELLDGAVFYTLEEASVVIERWRRHYNSLRPHSSLGYHPPAPEVVMRGSTPGRTARGPDRPHPASVTGPA